MLQKTIENSKNLVPLPKLGLKKKKCPQGFRKYIEHADPPRVPPDANASYASTYVRFRPRSLLSKTFWTNKSAHTTDPALLTDT